MPSPEEVVLQQEARIADLEAKNTELRKQLEELTQERDALKMTAHRYKEERLAVMTAEMDAERYKHEQAITINERLLSDNRIAAEQLAAAQAREQQLREAVEEIAKAARLNQSTWGIFIQDFCVKTLALPQDTSALDARLKEERERCAVKCDHMRYASNQDIAAAIRGMK